MRNLPAEQNGSSGERSEWLVEALQNTSSADKGNNFLGLSEWSVDAWNRSEI